MPRATFKFLPQNQKAKKGKWSQRAASKSQINQNFAQVIIAQIRQHGRMTVYIFTHFLKPAEQREFSRYIAASSFPGVVETPIAPEGVNNQNEEPVHHETIASCSIRKQGTLTVNYLNPECLGLLHDQF